MANVKIESDALVTVNLINEGPHANHPLSTIISDSKTILTGTNSTITYVSRGANECTDRVGAEQEEDFKILTSCPISLREFLLRDSLNLRQFLD